MEKFRAADFAQWCRQQYENGCGYIMCAIGQDPKKLSEWYFSGQYSGRALEKANYWRKHAPRVFDCQGLADGYLTEKIGQKIDVRARGNYASWCGEFKGEGMIPPAYRQPGAAVFKRADYVHHVGFLLEPVEQGHPEGDWWVIEAKGVMYGVVKTRLLQNEWNLWGHMVKYFTYEPVEEQPQVIKRGASGDQVKGLQSDLIALGYSCGKWGADGEFGPATEQALRAYQYDRGLEESGLLDEDTRAALDVDLAEHGESVFAPAQPAAGMLRVQGGTWYVRAQPGKDGAILGVVRSGDRLARNGQRTQGWAGVWYGTEAAWISEKGVVDE